MVTREEILSQVSRELQTLFELSEEQITLQARLYEDLDLDSIDAVDLIVRLQALSKKRVRTDQVKTVRNVSEIVDAVEELLSD